MDDREAIEDLLRRHGPDVLILAVSRRQPPGWSLAWAGRLALLAWRRKKGGGNSV
jgi:DNA-binding transcriptional MocR family regulator